MQTMISNTKRNLVSSRASRKVDEGGNGKNDNDLHIMVSFVTKRDININIFRTTFNHHFLENILKRVYPIVFVPNIFPNSRLIQKCIHIWQLFWKKLELGKIFETKTIGSNTFTCFLFTIITTKIYLLMNPESHWQFPLMHKELRGHSWLAQRSTSHFEPMNPSSHMQVNGSSPSVALDMGWQVPLCWHGKLKQGSNSEEAICRKIGQY